MQSSMSQEQPDMLAGPPHLQWQWHEAFRDMSKNMYRTTYTDSTHFREVSVKSDYPSGYGGHVPSLRHDVLFRNTEFDRKMALTRNDPSRDAHPSFNDQLAGIPTITAFPAGARKNPTFKTVPHDGTSNTGGRPPWAVCLPKRVLNQRHLPDTIHRTRSQPALGSSGRVNDAALGAGAMVASPARTSQLSPSIGLSPQLRNMKRSVAEANEQAQQGRVPTASEILNDNMN